MWLMTIISDFFKNSKQVYTNKKQLKLQTDNNYTRIIIIQF